MRVFIFGPELTAMAMIGSTISFWPDVHIRVVSLLTIDYIDQDD